MWVSRPSGSESMTSVAPAARAAARTAPSPWSPWPRVMFSRRVACQRAMPWGSIATRENSSSGSTAVRSVPSQATVPLVGG